MDFFLFSSDPGWGWAITFNFLLVCILYRVPLLTYSGWAHSAALGTILLACIGWKGWFAVAIYFLMGSLVTRLGIKKKKQEGLSESRGGKRGPENVWGSAGTGASLALLLGCGIGSDYLILVGFASSFCAKLADTFGSEIGKRWGKETFLITSFEKVPAGTEGAISIEGSIASLVGSILMAIVMLRLDIIVTLETAVLISVVGLMATLCESIFGATIQNKYKWMTNELINFLQTTLAALLGIALISYI